MPLIYDCSWVVPFSRDSRLSLSQLGHFLVLEGWEPIFFRDNRDSSLEFFLLALPATTVGSAA